MFASTGYPVDLPSNTTMELTLYSERETRRDMLHVGHFMTN